MWYLQNTDDKYLLSEIDSQHKVHTVKEKEAAKSFDSQDQAEGFALAVKQFSGIYFSAVSEDDV
jgi:hypothetical protein